VELSDAIDRIGRMIEQEEVLAREAECPADAAYHDERRRALVFVLEALRSRLA
jgi:hypothetical protein